MARVVQVIDSENQVLFECSIEEQEKAYNYAKSMEEMGIEVNLKTPSLPETLIDSLGANEDDQKILQKEIDEEIDSHDSSCLNCDDNNS